MSRDLRSEAGNALVEFVYLAVLLMVPLVYVLISVFFVQRAAFGTTEAARQAGRAYARAATVDEAERRATAAARLVLADQGLVLGPSDLTFTCRGGPCLSGGSRVQITVKHPVRLPILGAVFGASDRGAIPVSATHTEYVDRYKAP